MNTYFKSNSYRSAASADFSSCNSAISIISDAVLSASVSFVLNLLDFSKVIISGKKIFPLESA